MALSDTTIRKAKPEAKPLKLYDVGGLYLLLNPSGSKWWRFKYRFDGKEKLLSLGIYPEVSLKKARERRDDARVTGEHDRVEHVLSCDERKRRVRRVDLDRAALVCESTCLRSVARALEP